MRSLFTFLYKPIETSTQTVKSPVPSNCLDIISFNSQRYQFWVGENKVIY